MKKILTVIALLITLAGCSKKPVVVHSVVDAISNSPDVGETYILLPANPAVKSDDVYFKEYARYVDILLADRLMSKESFDNADIAILVGIDFGKINDATYTLELHEYEAASELPPQPHYNTPENNRHLLLTAIDLKTYRENGKKKVSWQVRVESSGSSRNLRYVAPYIVAAVSGYIGTNTYNDSDGVRVLATNDLVVKMLEGKFSE